MASGWSRAILAISGELLFWATIIFAIFVGSFWGLLLLPIGLFAVAVAVNRFFPLVPIDAKLAKVRRRAEAGFWLAICVLVGILVIKAL